MSKPGDSGTCGFCGTGEGWLGEQGDESTQHLHSAVRTGEAPSWEYGHHPGALKNAPQTIVWCGHCVGGLEHKYQRMDTINFEAKFSVYKLWLEMDGPRWEAHYAPADSPLKKLLDDPGIHLEKLYVEREVNDMQQEAFRRAGFDLTTRGWRP